jgi:branched-chain amino acid transport system substrate-binding protein
LNDRNTAEQERLDRRSAVKKIVGAAIGGAVIGSLGVAAYYGSQPTSGVVRTTSGTPLGKPLKVGITGPMTGTAALSGQNLHNGVLLAYEDLKAAGFYPMMIDGELRDVEFVDVDSTDPEAGRRAFESAIDIEGVDLFTVGWYSSVALSQIEVMADRKKVWVGSFAITTQLNDTINSNPERYKYYFKGWPPFSVYYRLIGDAFEQLIKEGKLKPRNRRYAVVGEESDYSREFVATVADSLNRLGFEQVSVDYVPVGATEYTSILTKIVGLDAGMVCYLASGQSMFKSFLDQTREFQSRLKALVLLDGVTWFGDPYQTVGDAVEYVISMDTPLISTTRQRSWVDRYKAKFQSEPSPASAGFAYDQFTHLTLALRQAQTTDPDQLVRALEQTRVAPGMMNRMVQTSIEAAPGKAISMHDFVVDPWLGFALPMTQFRDGRGWVVWPPAAKERDFEQPPWLG